MCRLRFCITGESDGSSAIGGKIAVLMMKGIRGQIMVNASMCKKITMGCLTCMGGRWPLARVGSHD